MNKFAQKQLARNLLAKLEFVHQEKVRQSSQVFCIFVCAHTEDEGVFSANFHFHITICTIDFKEYSFPFWNILFAFTIR